MKSIKYAKIICISLLFFCVQAQAQNTVGYHLGHPSGTSFFGFGTYSGGWKFSNSTSNYPTVPFIATGTYGGTNINFFINGGIPITNASATAGVASNAHHMIGAGWNNTTTETFDGYISEITIFASALSTADRQTIECNQANTYSVAAITTHPSSSAQNLCINGVPTDLVVTACGTGLTYQWYKNSTASTVGATLIAGATNSTYTPSTSAATDLYYYVVISGVVNSDFSGLVKVSNNSNAGTSPADQSICSTVTPASIALTGTVGTIQWQSSTDNINFTNVAGATATTLPNTTIGALTQTKYYKAIATSGACTSATSNVVTINVNALPTISSNPSASAQTLCLNTTPSAYSVTAAAGSGTISSYKWYNNSNSLLTTNTSSSTSDSYTPSTSTTGATSYYAVVTNSNNCTVTSTTSGAVTVNVLPIVAPITGNSAVCIGSSINLASASSTMNTTQAFAVAYSLRKLVSAYAGNAIQVRRSSDNTFQNIGFNAYGDLDTASLKTFVGSGNGFVVTWYDQSGNAKNMAQSNATYQPQIVFSGLLKYIGTRPAIDFNLNKGVFNSSAATIAAVGGVIKSEATSTYTEHHAILDASVRMGGLLQSGGNTFHSNKYPAALWKNGTSITTSASLSPINQGMVLTYTTSVTTQANLCIGNYDAGTGGGAVLQSEVVAFNTSFTTADRQTVEASQGYYYGVTVSGSGVVNSSGTGVWTTSDASLASVGSSTGVVTGVGVGTPTITYTLTDANSCVSAVTKSITVNALPVISADPSTTSQTVCQNAAATALTVSATAAGTITYQWYSNTSASTIGSTSLGSANGAQTATYTPTSTTAGSFYYYCVVTSSACSVTSGFSGAITYTPVSVAGTISGAGGVCVGSTKTLTLSGNTGTIQWQVSSTSSTTGFSDIAGETASTYLVPSSTAAGTYYYQAVVTNGVCSAATTASAATVPVIAFPTVADITGNDNVCTNASSTFANATSGGVWSSTTTSLATVNSTSGVLTGVSAGPANLSYTVTNYANGQGANGSVLLNGTNQSLSLSPGIGTIGTGAFTFECWFKLNSSTLGRSSILGTGTGNYLSINVNSLTEIETDAYGVNRLGFAVPTMSVGTWYHLAVVRNSSGTETIFLNGVRSTTGAVTDSKNYNGPSQTIGYWQAGTYFPGNLASIRAVVGSSVYDPTQSTITVPSFPLTSVTNTKLLLLAQSSAALLTDGSGVQTVTNNNASTWSSSAPATSVGCPTTVTKTVTVNPLPVVAPITGTTSICYSLTSQLASSPSGGVWTSATQSVATINSSTGLVSAVAPGTSLITYTYTDANGCSKSVTTTMTITSYTLGAIGGIGINTAEVLMVAGGGGGGGPIGGGGGGGGVIYMPSFTPAVGSTTYPIVVGAGGADRVKGSNTTAFGATAAGGGTSAGHDSGDGTSGGSGGGAASNNSRLNVGGVATGSSLGSNTGTIYGNRGGNMLTARVGTPTAGAGGGGAGGAAADVSSSVVVTSAGGAQGRGGDGIASNILGTTYYFGGGGGGGAYFNGYAGNGGIGGGGAGSINGGSGIAIGGGSALNAGGNGQNGDNLVGGNGGANTGGGGGAGSWSGGAGGAGGSGIVIIKYPGAQAGTGGDQIISSGGYTIHKFTTVGTSNFVVTGGNSICLNDTKTLTNSTIGGTWLSSDPTIASVNATSGVLTGLSVGTVNITYTVNVNGCDYSITKSVTVNPLPTVAAITGATEVCVNSTITLSNATASGVWTSGNTATATVNATTGVVTGVASGTVTITYTVTNAYSCATAVTYSVIVNALPIISVQPATTTQSICLNGTSSAYGLTAAAGSGTITSYKWYNNSNALLVTNTSSSTTDTYTPVTTVAGTLSYYAVVTNSNGCSTTSATTGAVTIIPYSVAGTVSANQSICTGTSPANITLSGNTGTIQWQSSTDNINFTNLTGTGVTTTTLPTATIGVLTATKYFRAIVTSTPCTSATSSVVTVTVNALPTISINPALTTQTLCVGATATAYSVTAAAGSGTLSTYKWYNNSNALLVTNTSSSTPDTYTPVTSAAGTLSYYAVVTNSNGCTATSSTSGAVTVISAPTITTTGTLPTLTYSTSNQTTSLAYTATTNTPTSYSIDWNAAANAAGLADQATTTFSFASGAGSLTGIVITPATAGISYSGVMTITNATGCSGTKNVTVTIQNVLDVIGLNSSIPAASAYSLRKLSSSYAGPLVRITIGTSYYDVYPDAGGAFSTSSLVSANTSTYNAAIAVAGSSTLANIIGSSSATVAVWYDQSGNGNHAYQATTSKQPRIINAGVIDKDGSNPSLLFTYASGQYLQTVNSITISGASSANAVSKAVSPSTSNYACIIAQVYPSSGAITYVLGHGTSTSLFNYSLWTGGAWQGSTTTVNYPTTSFVATGTYGGTVVSSYLNGVASTAGVATSGLSATQPLVIGKRFDGTVDTYNGYISETMVFPSTLSTTSRQAIECNQGSYYGISVNGCATSIISHPASAAQNVCKNATASRLTVEASGASLTYQWYSNTTASNSNGTIINGATSSSYTPSTSTLGTLYYYVVVNGTIAPLSVTSNVSGAITTVDLPSITAAAAANSACYNRLVQTTGLTYSAVTNNPVSYSIDWNAAANTAGLADQATTSFAFVAGGGTLTGIVVTASTPMGNYTGTLTITNANGCTYSQAITLSVTSSPSFSSAGSSSSSSLSALNFDGTNDYLSVAQNSTLNITSAITMEAWVYPTKSTGIQNVMSKSSQSQNNGYIFPRTDNGWNSFVVYLNIGGWKTFSYPYPSRNTWHHLAATYDGSNIKLYLDGNLVGTKAQTGSISTNTNILGIGNQPGYNEYFGGTVDELRLWNVARSVSEIRATMNTELTGAESGLIAYYNFNQGTPGGTNTSLTTITDITGRGNSGTINNFAKTGTSSNVVAAGPSLTGGSGGASAALSASVCYNANAQSASLVYAQTYNSPTSYSIDWDSTANSKGLTDQAITTASFSATGGTLTGIVVPAAVVGGTYTGNIILYSANGCSGSASITLTISSPSITSTGIVAPKCYSTSAQITTMPYTGTTGSPTGYSIDWDATANTAGLLDQSADATLAPPFGNGLDFDGSNDIVTTNLSLSGRNKFTFEGWIYPKSSGSRVGFFGQNDALEFGFIGSNTIGLWTPSGGSINWNFDGTSFPLNKWHHVAAVGNGTNIKIYVDGVLKSTGGNGTSNYGSSSDKFNIGGAVWDACCNNFKGTFDDVRVWGVERTAQEILDNMNVSISTPQTGLLAYYKFDQGSANNSNSTITTVTDATGLTSGTASNFTLSGSSSNWVTGANSSGNAGITFTTGSGNVTGIQIPASVPAGTYSGVLNTINSTTGCTASIAITFTINGAVISSPTTATSQSVCLNGSPNPLTVTISGSSLTYQWYSSTTNVNTGGTSLGSVRGAQTNTYTPLATIQGTTYYYVIVNNGSCSVTSPIFQVNVGNSINNVGAGSGLPNASVAYAFRTLSTCYTGPLGRFRIGANYYDVYGDAANGSLSLSSYISASTTNASASVLTATSNLLSSVVNSSTAAYVAIWYDQSGNGKNLTQTNTTYQPRIINAGVIESENGKPFIRWIARASLNLPADLNINGQVMVVNKFGAATNADGFLLGHTNSYYWHGYPSIYGNNRLFASNGWTSSSIINGSVWQNGTSMAPTAAIYNRTLMVNSVQPQTPNSGTTWNNIGFDRSCHYTTVDGGYSEIIVFPTALTTTSRQALETNEYNYYITSYPIITAQPSTAAQTICTGLNATALSVTATGTGLSYKWYSNANNSINGGTIISGATTNTYTPPVSAAGTTYYYVVVSNSSGVSVTSSVSGAITVKTTPTITGTTPASRCGSGSVTLAATSSAGTVNWYTNSGVAITSGNSYTTPSLSATTVYNVDATLNGCTTSSKTSITATINAAPVISVTAASRCGTGTVSLSASSTGSATISWYDALTGGSLLGTGTGFTTPSLSSTTTYYVDASSSAGCAASARKAVIATVNPIPTILSTSTGSTCGSGTVVIGALASSGTLNWYANASGGSILASGNTFTTPSITTSTTYYVDATANGCTSTSRTAVLATIKYIPVVTNSAPSISSGAITTFCDGDSLILTSSGAAGNALNFVGSSAQYVEANITSLPSGNNSFTAEALIKTSGTSAMTIMNWGTTASNQQAGLKVVNGHLYFAGGSNDLEGSTSINDDNWHHVAASFDGTTVTLYVDGVTEATAANTLNNNGTTLRLARQNSPAGADYFTGKMDEVRVWSTARSQSQIQAYKNLSAPFDATGLLVSYKLNEASGSVANNALGINNGTLYNAPTWVSNTLSTFTYASYLWTNGNTTPSTTAKTSNSYKITVTDADGCSSSSSSILVTVNPVPTITDSVDNEICGTGSIVLGATASAGTIKWYNASVGGSLLASGTSYTPTLSSSATYYVDATLGSCTTARRSPVVATVNPLASITGVTGGTICVEGRVTLQATSDGGSINWYTSPTGGSAIATGTSFTTPDLTATTIYYVDASLGSCTSTSRTAVTATVTTSAAVGTINGAIPVCSGTNSTALSLSSYSGSVQWQYSTDDITYVDINSAASPTYTATNLSIDSSYYRVVVTGGCNSITSASVSIAANSPSQVGTLTGGANLCSGSNSAMLTFDSYNGDIVWKYSTDNSTFYDLSDGTNNPFYMVTDLLATTYYKAVVTSSGCGSVTSNTQTVSVNPAALAGTITGDGTVCSSTNSKTLTLSGYSGNIQWQSSSDNINFADINSATTSTYTATNTTSDTYFRAILSSGSCTATANSVMIGSSPSPVAGTISGAGSVCFGSNSTGLSVTGYTGTIQWQSSDDNSTFTNIDGETSDAYYAFDLIATTYYRAILTTNCGSATTTSVSITVNLQSDGGSISGNAPVCTGTNSTLLTLGNNIGTTKQWQSSTDDVSFVNIPSATGTTYTATNLTATTYYRASVINPGCSVAYSLSVPMVVNPNNTVTAASASPALCINSLLTPITHTTTGATGIGTATGLPAGVTASWANNVITISGTPSVANTFNYSIPLTGGCGVFYATGTITVNPLPIPSFTVQAGATACAGIDVTYTTQASQTNYVWTYTGTLNTDYTITSGGTSADNTVTLKWLTSAGTKTASVNYTNSNGCTAVSATASTATTISPVSVGGTATPTSATLCYASNTTVTLSGHTGTIQWQQSADGSTGWATVTGGSGGTTATYTTPGLTATTYYRAVVTSGVCVLAYSSTATVTVNPTSVGGTLAGSATVCAVTNSTTITLSGNTGSVTKWQSSLSSGFTSVTDIANTTSTLVASNLSATTYYRAVVASGVCPSANSASGIVTVNPTSVSGTISGAGGTCFGFAKTLTLSGNTGTIQWQVSTTSSSSDFSNIVGATASTYTVATSTAVGTYYYQAVVTSGVCASATTASVTVNVNALPVIVSQTTTAQTYCQNATATPLTVTATDGGTITYQWYSNATASNSGGTSLGTATGAQTASYTPLTTVVGTKYYYCIVTNVNGCIATSAVSGAIVVNVVPVISSQSTSTQTRCQNVAAAALTVTATGTGLTYQWYSNTTASNTGGASLGTATGAQTSSYIPLTTVFGTTYYYCVVTNSIGCTTTSAVSGAIIVNETPVIVSQSTVAQTVCQNSTPTDLSVTTTSTGTTTYQWYSNVSASNSGGTSISGATSSSYTPLTATSGTKYYYCIATIGSCSITSAVSGAVVVTPLSVSGTISGAGGTCFGFAKTLTLSGNTGTIQWQVSTTSSSTGFSDISGAVSATYVVSSTTSVGTYYYQAVVTNGVCASATTASVTVNVNALPVIVSQTTAAQTYCQNATATPLTVTATDGGTITYQWYSNTTASNTGGTSLGTATGAQTASYTPLTTVTGTKYYYCIVTNGNGCIATSAVSGAILVNVIPAITSQSTATQTRCQNVAASALTVTATGTTSYQWYSNSTASNANGTSLGTATGAQTASYTPLTTVFGTTYYYCVVTNGLGCSVSSAVSGAIIVNETPVLVSQSTAAQTVCQNSTPTDLSVTTTSTGTTTYQWYSNASASNSGGASILGATSSSYTPPTGTPGTKYYYCIATIGSCSITSAVSGAVVVTPLSVSGTISGAGGTCFGFAKTLTLSGYTGTIQWQVSTTSSSTGFSDISGAVSATYVVSSSTAVGTYYYQAVVTNGVCASATTASVTVNVNALPVIVSQTTPAQTYCRNATATPLTMNATGTGLTYQWWSNTTASIGGTAVSLGTATGAQSDSYTPLTTSTGTLYYYCIITNVYGCTTTSAVSGAILVNALPAIPTISASGSTTFCNGGSVTLTSTAGSTYLWSTGATTQSISVTSSGSYSVTVSNANGCLSSSVSTMVTVNALPSITGTLSVCAGSTTALSGTATAASSNAWVSATTGVATINSTSGLVSGVSAGTSVITYTNNNGCAITATVTVNARPIPSFTAQAGATACAGVDVTYTTQASQTNYVWTYTGTLNTDYSITSGGSSADNTVTLKWLTSAGTKTVSVNYTNSNGCTAVSATASTATTVSPVSVGGTATPTAATLCYASNTTVTLSDNTGTIQWQQSADGSTGWATVTGGSGATSATYTTPGLTATTYFRAVVTSGVCTFAYSSTATVTVNPTSVGGTLAGSATVCNGTNSTTLTLSGNTGAVTKWQSSLSSGFTSVTDITNSTNTIVASNLSATTYYRAVVTSGVCPSANSASGIVTVNPTSVAGTISGAGSTCNGTAKTLTLSGNTGTIQWQVSATSSSSGFGDIAGATASTYTVPTTTAVGTYYYQAVVTSGVCTSATSASATVVVLPDNSITLSSAAGTNAQTASINISMTNITYTTTGATGASFSGLPAGVSGSWSSNTVTISGTATATGTYNFTVTLTGGCGTVTTTGTITVVSGPSAVVLSGTAGICIGSTANLKVTVTGGSTPYTVVYRNDSTGTNTTLTNYVSGANIPLSPSSTMSFSLVSVSDFYGNPGNGLSGRPTITVYSPSSSAKISGTNTICSGNTTKLRVAITGGTSPFTVVYQDSLNNQFTVNNYLSDSNIVVNPTTAKRYTLVSVTSTGGCAGTGNTDTARISIGNVWIGGPTGNWNVASNWCAGVVPVAVSSALLITAATPVVNTSITTTSPINLDSGASLVTGNNANVTLNSGASLNLSSGSSVTINPGSTMTVAAGATANLANQPLVIKSDAISTGALGPIEGTITGAENVVVERYISTGRKWRFLAAPLNGRTFKEAWQEGATTAGGNPNSGYGFLIGGVGSTALSKGFDLQSGNAMVKVYSSLNNAWVGISRTDSVMDSQSGYMCFVAGDRSGISATTSTTTRMTGALKYGTQAAIAVPNNSFVAVGNPYPSAVKLTSINVTNLRSVFYVWDPNLAGGSYGLGGYQTLTLSGGNYQVTPGGGSYGANGSVVTNLESGQAFFIQGNSTGGAGSIQFKEQDKGVGSVLVFFAPELPQRVMVNLGALQADSSVLVADGVMVRYADNYNNAVTDEDFLKMGNTNENVALLSGGKTLAVENRNGVQNNDTLHLNLSGVRVQSYQWSLNLDNMDAPGRVAFLLDRYKQTSTPLNMAGTTKLNFTIENIPGSYASDRFKIVFSKQSVLPVTITSVNAIRNSDKTVGVLWKTANETNLNNYEVERSVNGVSFTSIGSVLPKANNGASAQYLFTDKDLIGGDLFYRIKAISEGGQVQYSSIVKIGASKGTGTMVASPNPVENRQLTIRYDGVETGSYGLALLNGAGQTVCSTKMTISGATGTQTIPLGKLLSSGNYLLLITSPDGSMRSEQVMVK